MQDNVELQATCAALGYLDGDKYHKEPDCLETVKDLIRFLKHDNDECILRRQLGEMEILQKDLIPIVKQHHDDRILLETVFRLMVNLTQPAKLCFRNEIPEDKTARNYYIEIESHLQSYKEAFADEKLFAVFTRKLGDLLKLDWEHRQEEDRLLIERIIILVRNMLHIPPNADRDKRTDDDVSIHDQVLWCLHTSGMEDLLLYIAGSEDERQFVFHVLEIMSLMFREQTAEQLANTGVSRAETEKEEDKRELEMALEKEKDQRKANILKYSSRHSNFGGTFVVTNVKSISENSLIYHKNLAREIQFDHDKAPRKRPRNRKPILETDVTRRSTLSIRSFLKEFCLQFLENCYNALMRTIRDSLRRSQTQQNDETYYLWAMRFFMEFNRRFNFRVELVSETMAVETFHYIQTQLQTYHEMIACNRKEGIVWSRRMHLALKSYYELLLNITVMDNSSDSSIRNSAQIIKGNVFYLMEYRDIFLLLLRKFDETKQSRAFLRDLIEASHLFLRMLEHYSKRHSHLVVQRKRRHGGQKKRKKTRKSNAALGEKSREELEGIWDEVSGELSAFLQGRSVIPVEVIPFDAASSTDIEQQRIDAVFRIQDMLRNKKPGEAISLMRNAREVWPERREFGLSEISPEDEFMALREIFFTELPDHARTTESTAVGEVDSEPSDNEINEEEREIRFSTVEQEFSFKDFVLRFATPPVVKCYVLLLADFRTNSALTNHCVVKMLHRLAFDNHLIGMLFQARLFRIFNVLLNESSFKTTQFQELRKFATHVLSKFFEVARQNNKVFVELFFWKNVKEAMEITEGYGTAEGRSTAKQTWREEEDYELRQLFDQFKGGLNDGKNVVDDIMANMIDQKKTRRQVIRQLAHLDLIGSAKDLKARKGRSNQTTSRLWREEEELELRRLFDQFRDAEDPIGEIIANLTVARSKAKVVSKILELGLVSDKKELRKKRRKGKQDGKRKRKAKKPSDGESSNESADHVTDKDDSDSSEDSSRDMVEGMENGQPMVPSVGGPDDVTGSSSSDESANESRDADEPLYVIRIRRVAGKCSDSGFKSAVDWLRNCLSRTADDRDEDGDCLPVPIVPLTDEVEDAMDSPVFQKLLKLCGVKSPANEQERFWRIPGSLTVADLRVRTSALADRPCDPNVPLSGNQQRARALQELIQKNNKALPCDQEDPTEDDRPNNENSVGGDRTDRGSDRKSQSIKRLLVTLSDSSSDEDRLMIDENGREESRSASKRRRQTSGDEEVVAPVADVTGDRVAEQSSRQDDLINALHTFPATVMTQPMSDSDLDDHVPIVNRKKKATILSDSEDSE